MKYINRYYASSAAAMAARSRSRRRYFPVICLFGSFVVGGMRAGRRVWFASLWMVCCQRVFPTPSSTRSGRGNAVASSSLLKPRGFRPGMRVRVTSGLLCSQIGLLAVLRPHERVLVLLQMLGGQQRIELATNAIEAIE